MKVFAVLTFFCAIGLALSEVPVHPMHVLTAGNQGKIINGDVAPEGQYIWQVSLQRFGSHFCGGSLIKAGFVMTAAHCTDLIGEVSAILGTNEWRNPGQLIAVEKMESHPSWNDRTLDYDYGIATLSSNVNLADPMVGLIDLADAEAEYAGGTMAITTGWGLTSVSPDILPDKMQVASVPLVSQTDCQRQWRLQTITDRMQCAAGSGSSSCMGDSGGPLIVTDSSTNSGYRLIGAVSWGSGTCDTSKPGVYAKISAARSWIDSQIGN